MEAVTTTIEREQAAATSAAVAVPMPPADRFMRRLLRLPLTTAPSNPRGAERAMTTSLLISAGRCILMYLVFPFVLPAVGLASGVGHGIGLVLASRRGRVHRDVDAPVLAGLAPEALALHRLRLGRSSFR